MHDVSVESMDNEDKLSTIKRINSGIMQLLKKIRLRSAVAVLLGACAGLSLTSSVLPTVFSSLGHSDAFSVRWSLASYTTYTMMVWGMGGWAARKTGNRAAGAVVMALLGLISGLLLTYAEIDRSVTMLLAGGWSAMIYGGIAGLLIASTLSGGNNPPADDASGPSTPNRSRQAQRAKSADRDFRMFRFFK